MDPIEGSFEVNDEVDEVLWQEPAVAAGTVSYTRDAEILNAARSHLA